MLNPPRAAIEDGADLVLFSGAKLLGGPQAGIILGRQLWIERLANYPLMRALRVDKLTLAGLEATLRLQLEEDLAWKEVPVFALAKTPLSELTSRAEEVVGALNGSLAHSLAEVAGSDGVSMTHVEGTYLAWIDVSDLGLDDPKSYFESFGVGFSPGRHFGANGFVRLNFACPRAMLFEAVSRFRAGVAALRG